MDVGKGSREPIGDCCFFDFCDSINMHLDEGHGLAEGIIGVPLEEAEDAVQKSLDSVECSTELLNTKLRRAVARTASLVAQIQRIVNSF